MNHLDKKTVLNILLIPFLFFLIMFIVKFIEFYFNISFVKYGVEPQTFSGLKGIFTSPFIHEDFTHLFNNSYPILILGSMLYAFYKKIANQILLWLFFITGFWLWIIGRPAFHIGASGIIYSLAAFLLVSGIIRKDPRLSAVSLIVIFLYGSMIWGILPTNKAISWESHLSGMLAGIIVAIFFKNEGPKRKIYQWEIDEELQNKIQNDDEIKINYIIKKRNS